MSAISSLSDAASALKRNAVLFGAAFLATTVNIGIVSADTAVPALDGMPMWVVSALIAPFFLGGLVAMAYEGLDGTTQFETLVDAGTGYYVPMLAGYVLFVLLVVAVTFVVLVPLIVVTMVVAGASILGGGPPTEGLVLLALFALVPVLAVLLPVFFLQFYGPAIVVSDLNVVGSFKRSAALVRRNPLSTLGYTAVSVGIGTVIGLGSTAFSLLVGDTPAFDAVGLTLPDLGLATTVAIGAVWVLVSTAASAFTVSYQVAFYRDRLESIA
jgi:hypothetical protein